MAFRNQLEPGSLVSHFLRHPPLGFAVCGDAPAPAFVAPFDLLTTADDDLKQRAAALPLYRYWSRWLRINTAFVGTTVSEYALLPDAAQGEAAADALAAALLGTLAGGHKLIIAKDIPQRSPLLAEADNSFADAFMAACLRRGCIAVEGQALAYVPIDFADIESYLARLSTSRRKNLKRKLRSRTELVVRRIACGDAFAEDAAIDGYYTLYQQVFAQSEVHFDQLSRDFFAAVLRDGTGGGIVFEYRRAADDALLGWNLCFEAGGKLIDKYIGFSYPAAREANLYFVSWMVNLEYAIERGLTHYVAGWTDPEVKRQLGASFTFTRHAVYVRNPLLRALARRFSGHFESDRQWSDAA